MHVEMMRARDDLGAGVEPRRAPGLDELARLAVIFAALRFAHHRDEAALRRRLKWSGLRRGLLGGQARARY